MTSKEVYNFVCDPIEVKRNPQTTVDAQFSLPYAVALALVKGKVGLNDFTKEAIKDKDVQRMASKVQILFKPVEGRAVLPAPGIIRLRTVDGKLFNKRVDFVKGHPKTPNSLEDCIEKMKTLVAYAEYKQVEKHFNRIRDLLLNLEEVDDIREMILLLNG